MTNSSRQFGVLTALMFLLGLSTGLSAEETAEGVEYPASIPDVISVDAEGLIDSITRHKDMYIIDARAAMDRKQGYIEGSVSLPDTETDCDSLGVLVPDLSRHLLFYCNGPKCGRSVKSINKAKSCGYTNLFWFRGGYEEWTAKGYPVLKE